LTLVLDEHTAKWLERASGRSRGQSSRSWRPRPHPGKLFRRWDFVPGDDLPEPFGQTTTAARQM